MATKKITVKDVLNLTNGCQPVHINFYAYGVYYGSSADSGTDAEELLENLRKDCIKAEVHRISTNTDGTLYINADII